MDYLSCAQFTMRQRSITIELLFYHCIIQFKLVNISSSNHSHQTFKSLSINKIIKKINSFFLSKWKFSNQLKINSFYCGSVHRIMKITSQMSGILGFRQYVLLVSALAFQVVSYTVRKISKIIWKIACLQWWWLWDVWHYSSWWYPPIFCDTKSVKCSQIIKIFVTYVNNRSIDLHNSNPNYGFLSLFWTQTRNWIRGIFYKKQINVLLDS